MAQYFEVHPLNPQPRLLKQAAQILEAGGIAAIPTDSSYALACHLDDKAAAEQLRRIRGVDERHHLTLLCRDLSELGELCAGRQPAVPAPEARDPGPFTFILEATKEVPRRVSHPSRRTIGLRVPDHPVTRRAARSARPAAARDYADRAGASEPMNDPALIRERFEKSVQAIVDAGACPMQPTTVIDLTGEPALVVRLGRAIRRCSGSTSP
jgi:tRNA threonylcarbamoyl adenosine modification protein (Sua5/YciO/YrdC/YwlC family)